MLDNYEDMMVGDELLSALRESSIITESYAKKTLALVEINTPKSGEVLLEIAASPLGADYISIRGRDVSWSNFKAVYTNFDKHNNGESVMRGLGVDPDLFPSIDRATAIRKELNKAVTHFRKKRFGDLVPPKDREKFYSRRLRGDIGGGDNGSMEPPTASDIDYGSRSRNTGRAGRIINSVNDDDSLFAGKFYNDISRIPKTRWSSWLKFWDREKTRLSRDTSLLGREWKKFFIMGYEVEPNALYEIWYNSLDSSFSVHDIRGVEVTRRASTLNETMTNLIRFVTQISPDDRGVLMNANNNIAKSMARSLVKGIEGDTRMQDMMRNEVNSRAQARKQRKPMTVDDAVKRTEPILKAVGSAARMVGDEVATATSVIGDEMRKYRKDQEEKRRKNSEEFSDFSDENLKAWRDSMKSSQNDASSATKKGNYSPTSGKKKDQIRFDKQESDVDLNKTMFAAVKKSQYDAEKRKEELLKSLRDERERMERDKAEKTPKTDYSAAFAAAKKLRDAEKRKEELLKSLRDKRERMERDKAEKTPKTDYAAMYGESLDPTQRDAVLDDMESSVRGEVESNDYRNMIGGMRREYQKPTNQFTAKALKSTFTDEIVQTYNKTRVERSWFNNWFWRNIGRGRRQPIQLPDDKPNIFKQAGNFVYGKRYSADFIVGFSLSDRINLEVWYITEPNPDYTWSVGDLFSARSETPKTISSFYVYDINSQSLVRSYLPYYRNAIQTVMAKIAAF